MKKTKPKTKQQFLEKRTVVKCDCCSNGIIYSHGAFGEPESSKCSACKGYGVIFNYKLLQD